MAAAPRINTATPGRWCVCNGGYQFGNRMFHDWNRAVMVPCGLNEALIHSCDVYFTPSGNAGSIRLPNTPSSLDWDRTGVELPSERVGIVPSTAWKQKARNQPWYPGETIFCRHRRGYVTVTPLQMASVIGTVANDGCRSAAPGTGGDEPYDGSRAEFPPTVRGK